MLQIFAFLENLFPNAKDGLDAHPLILDIQLSEVKVSALNILSLSVLLWQDGNVAHVKIRNYMQSRINYQWKDRW